MVRLAYISNSLLAVQTRGQLFSVSGLSVISIGLTDCVRLKKMMKNVKKATPELATSKTIVWWDMDTRPLPNGYDPSRVGPRIDTETELKNQGYNGPLTIIGIGNLEGVPSSHDFLKALSSGGVVIKQLPLGKKSISLSLSQILFL